MTRLARRSLRAAVPAALIISVVTITTGCTTMSVSPVSGGIPRIADGRGVYYSLPQTILALKLPVTRTFYKRGPFFDRAGELGFSPPKALEKKDENTRFQLGAAEISAAARPDPKHVYRVDFQSHWAQDRELLLEFSELGLLTSGDAAVKDRTVEYVVATIKAVSRAAAGFALPGAPLSPRTDEDFDELKAALEIIRKNRIDLISGKTNQGFQTVDRETLELMLRELDNEELALREEVWSESVTAGVIIAEGAPQLTDVAANRTLFKLNLDQGTYALVPESNSEWTLRFPEDLLKPGGAGPDVAIQITPLVASYFSNDNDKSCGCARLGLRYRIPAPTRVRVTHGNAAVAVADMPIAQLGAVVALPAWFNSLDSRVSLKLYEQTGAVKSIQTKTAALDPALIDKLGDAAENFGKAEGARRAAADAGVSPFKKATDRLVEFQNLIKTLGQMGVPVPAWALQAPAEGTESE